MCVFDGMQTHYWVNGTYLCMKAFMYVCQEEYIMSPGKNTLTRLRNGTYASLWKVATSGLCA